MTVVWVQKSVQRHREFAGVLHCAQVLFSFINHGFCVRLLEIGILARLLEEGVQVPWMYRNEVQSLARLWQPELVTIQHYGANAEC